MIAELMQMPLRELQAEASRIKKERFGNEIVFAIPDVLSFGNAFAGERSNHFPAVSVTGSFCALQCDHCRGKILESMVPVQDRSSLLDFVRKIVPLGATGILLSGGSDRNGKVPLDKFVPAIRAIKEKYHSFRIIAHTGLIDRSTAKNLKDAGIDQILVDMIGDDSTLRDILHLDRRVQDYESMLCMLKEIGIRSAPHIVIGLHRGELRGEWNALDIVSRVGVDTIVLVVIKSLFGRAGSCMKIPAPEETSKVAAVARILNPDTPIRMGCIKPAHAVRARMEIESLASGINTIAYPLQRTIDTSIPMGFRPRFEHMCCSLV